MTNIRHLWLDFSDTIARTNRAELETIACTAYGAIVGKPVDAALKAEYQELVRQHKSNSAVFSALGMPPGYAADLAAKIPPKKLYELTDSHIPEVIATLKNQLPVSIFSNNRLDAVLPALGLERAWFTHILGPDEVRKPKPHPEGFLKMVELSRIPADEILFVGDDIEKDLLPAKEAGITTGLLWKQSDEADRCFANFTELQTFLERK